MFIGVIRSASTISAISNAVSQRPIWKATFPHSFSPVQKRSFPLSTRTAAFTLVRASPAATQDEPSVVFRSEADFCFRIHRGARERCGGAQKAAPRFRDLAEARCRQSLARHRLQLIECQVHLQDIHSRLAQESKLAVRCVLINDLTRLGSAQATFTS